MREANELGGRSRRPCVRLQQEPDQQLDHQTLAGDFRQVISREKY